MISHRLHELTHGLGLSLRHTAEALIETLKQLVEADAVDREWVCAMLMKQNYSPLALFHQRRKMLVCAQVSRPRRFSLYDLILPGN